MKTEFSVKKIKGMYESILQTRKIHEKRLNT